MSIALELARVQQREQIAAWDQNEKTLAARLPQQPKPALSADIRTRWDRFADFCRKQEVRSLPAKPATVAAYLADEIAQGMDVQHALALLAAIEAAHDHAGLANPVRTAVARQVLDGVVKVEPPRSWPAADKAEFALLPPEIREVIAKREQERDRALRRAQNELAEERKHLNGGEKPTEERIENHG
jgi:hypothetical protein